MGNALRPYEALTAVVPESGNEALGLGPIYRQKNALSELKLEFFEGCRTLWDLFCYRDIESEVIAFAGGAEALGLLRPIPFTDHKRSDGQNLHLVGFLSRNRIEWTVAEYALFRRNVACVPLYDVLSPSAIDHVIQETGLKVMICEGSKCSRLLDIVQGNSSLSLRTIVSFDPLPEGVPERVKSLGLTALLYADVVARGRALASPVEIQAPAPEDPCLIVYTSGTTGPPKGVIVPHCALASLVQSTMHHHAVCRAGNGHFVLSYLPLAHVFEQFCEANILSSGGAVGYFTDKEHLLEDIRVLRPTAFASVPRIFNRMRDAILNRVRATGGVKQFLFNKGMETKGSQMDSLNCATHWFYDIIFGKIKASLGFDRLQFALSGSAPLSSDVQRFFRIIFGVPVMQGYGLTESGGGLCCEIPDCYNSYGTCGVPVVSTEARLVSVPEMGYLVSDKYHGRRVEDNHVLEEGTPCCGRGEVVFRGYNRTSGYFRRPDWTNTTIDESGWFHTGDIALWTPEGFLQIVDRKKNIIKLSQGEYVAIEEIENTYLISPFIDQIMVYGDSFQSHLVAVVVPDFDYVRYWLKASSGITAPAGNMDIARLPEVKAAILEDMNGRIAKEKKMSPLELVRHIFVEAKAFTQEEDLITPTMKLKRVELKNKYMSVLRDLHREVEASTAY